MVASTQHSLEHQSHAHSVKNTKLLGDSLNIIIKKICFFSTDVYLVYNVASGLCFNDVTQLVYSVSPRFVFGDDEESRAKTDVANVTEEMVEVRESPQGEGALVVEVTDILVPSLVRLLLVLEDELEGGDGVGDAHGEDEPDVHVVALK